MALILKNDQISDDIYQMDVKGSYEGRAGQFYMLESSSNLDPFLHRPISINDIDQSKITFLYQKKGKGTALLAKFKVGDAIEISGPYGNGFNFFDSDTIFVGGGIGIAPLYLAVKSFKKQFPHRKAIVYLGFNNNAYYIGKFQSISDHIQIKTGGKITDIINYDLADHIITCGPEIMMKNIDPQSTKHIQVSMEKRMACAVGACLGCSITTTKGMKRVCKDGPVFLSSEVFYE